MALTIKEHSYNHLFYEGLSQTLRKSLIKKRMFLSDIKNTAKGVMTGT